MLWDGRSGLRENGDELQRGVDSLKKLASEFASLHFVPDCRLFKLGRSIRLNPELWRQLPDNRRVIRSRATSQGSPADSPALNPAGAPFNLLRPGGLDGGWVFGWWFVEARQQFGSDVRALVGCQRQDFAE